MYKKNIILVLLLNLTLIAGAQASDWLWQKDCKPAAMTQCEVWFNSLVTVDKVIVNKGNKKLDSEFKTYTKLEKESFNAILIHVSGLDKKSNENLQQGLIRSIDKTKTFQKFAIYSSGGNFNPHATFGMDKDKLKATAKNIKLGARADYGIAHLESLIKIMGGVQGDKKVIYWVTEGVTLTDAKLTKLSETLKNDKIRLVITHLHKNDISQNSGDALAKLAKQTNGLYQQATPKQWTEKLSLLGEYSANGGELSIKTKALCGPVKLSFTASSADNQEIKSVWKGNYPACAAAPVAQPTPTTPSTPAPQGTTPTTGNTETGTTTGTDAPATQPGTTDPGAGGTQGETTQPQEPAQDKTKLIAIGAAIALVVLIVLVFVIVKRGKKTPAQTQQKQAYGVLVDTSGSEEKIYSLEKDAVKIGRSQECDVVLINDSVSAIHAELKRQRDGAVTIIDLKSSNGTKVNNEEVVHNTVLESGDVIIFGEARLTFKLN